MKRSVLKISYVIVMAIILSALSAPLAAGERDLSLHQIIEFAQKNNGELKALRAEIDLGEASKIRAGLAPNPVLDLEVSTGELSGSEYRNLVSIGVSQEFISREKREKRLTVAESEQTGLESRVKDAERLLTMAVKTEYFDLLLAQGRLDLAQELKKLNSKLLQITQELLDAGDIAELDVNLVKVEVARSEGRIIEAEREIIPARHRLLGLMGATPTEDLIIEPVRVVSDVMKCLKGAGPAENPQLAWPSESKALALDLAELKSLAQTHRPDLRTAASESRRGEASLALAQVERSPNLTAGIGFSRDSDMSAAGGFDDRSTNYIVDLKFSIPLPFSDRNQAAIREAQARKSSAMTRHASIKQTIEHEVEAAHARLAAAKKTLQLYIHGIFPQLMENLQLMQNAYRLGEIGILAVLEEHKKFIGVNEDYLTALYNRNIAVAKLEAAVGVELPNEGKGKQ